MSKEMTVSDVIARALTLPVRSKIYAYEQGLDCAKNGANDTYEKDIPKKHNWECL